LSEKSIKEEIYAPNEGISLWWLGQAGFAASFDEVLLFIDPVIELEKEEDPLTSEIGLRLFQPLPLLAREVTQADLVLLSHDHRDHTAPKTVPYLARTDAIFLCTEHCAGKVRELGVKKEKIRPLNYGEELKYEGLKVECVIAEHSGPRGTACGFIIRSPHGSLYYPGDTSLLPEHLELKDIDILLLSITENVLGIEGAAKLANALGSQYLIPCHYGTYDHQARWTIADPEALRPLIDRSEERLFILKQGERFHIE
jgi:L-ascorbate metabolism protein UlaG (beta-lactamase superfamily)